MTTIHVQPTFDLSTKAEKDAQRQVIAADLARFRKAGGKVEVLGTSPIDRAGISRRQVVEGGADRRKAAKGGKA